MLYEKGRSASTYTLQIKQDELSRQLGISRQALNVHLRKLRDLNCVHTGRGFIDVTEKGLDMLGISSTPAFIFVRVSPATRIHVYNEIKGLAAQRAFRIAGEFDVLMIVEREKLDEVLKRLYTIDGYTRHEIIRNN